MYQVCELSVALVTSWWFIMSKDAYSLFFHTILIIGATGLPGKKRSVAVDNISKVKSVGELESYEEIGIEWTEPGMSSERANLFDRLYPRFSCHSRANGFYADSLFDCRIFHKCDDNGEGYPIICPGGSFFDQRQQVCTDEPSIECDHAPDWFHVNELPATNPLEMTRMPEEDEGASDQFQVPTVLPLVPT